MSASFRAVLNRGLAPSRGLSDCSKNGRCNSLFLDGGADIAHQSNPDTLGGQSTTLARQGQSEHGPARREVADVVLGQHAMMAVISRERDAAGNS
jgi:hypothetical protein